ncbi:hypothetical protein D3C71_1113670 [compost metagenome]
MQIIRAPECFVFHLRLQSLRGKQRLACMRAIGQHPGRHRGLLRIEIICVAQVRQVLALVAAGILPTAPDIHLARGLEDAQVAVGGIGVAAAVEVAQQLRAGRGESCVVADRHRCRHCMLFADAHIYLVLAALLDIRKVDAEIALARTPLGERLQRLQIAALYRLAITQHGVAALSGFARIFDNRPLRAVPFQRYLVDLHQQWLGGQAHRHGGRWRRGRRRDGGRCVQQGRQRQRQRGDYLNSGLAGMRQRGHRHGSG